MLLLIDIFSIKKGRGYENPSLDIIVTKHCSIGGFPLEEACEHFFLNQSAISISIVIYFLTGLSRRGSHVTLTGDRGCGLPMSEYVHRYCDPDSKRHKGKFAIRSV